MKYPLTLLFALFTLAPAAGEPVTQAHPALWHVQGPAGEAYLFGSIHLLPKNLNWRTRQVNAAINRADVFVFEVSTDAQAQEEIRELIAERRTVASRPIAARHAAAGTRRPITTPHSPRQNCCRT